MTKKEIKIFVLRFLLMLEVVVFGFTYLFGRNGIVYLIKVNKENQTFKNELSAMKNEIKCLDQQIYKWNNDSFYKEKVGREKLQMAGKNDEVYYFDK